METILLVMTVCLVVFMAIDDIHIRNVTREWKRQSSEAVKTINWLTDENTRLQEKARKQAIEVRSLREEADRATMAFGQLMEMYKEATGEDPTKRLF